MGNKTRLIILLVGLFLLSACSSKIEEQERLSLFGKARDSVIQFETSKKGGFYDRDSDMITAYFGKEQYEADIYYEFSDAIEYEQYLLTNPTLVKLVMEAVTAMEAGQERKAIELEARLEKYPSLVDYQDLELKREVVTEINYYYRYNTYAEIFTRYRTILGEPLMESWDREEAMWFKDGRMYMLDDNDLYVYPSMNDLKPVVLDQALLKRIANMK